MTQHVSLYIPNEININDVRIGNTYKIDYNNDGINYRFIGKVTMGSTYSNGSIWLHFYNVKKYFVDNVYIVSAPVKGIDFGYIPDPYIPEENELRVWKHVYGPDSNIYDSIRSLNFKLNYIKEFPYEIIPNFRLLPTDINREIRSYLY